MDQQPPPRSRRRRRASAGLPVTPPITPGDPSEVADAINRLLDRPDLDVDERVQLLGCALVMEALRPHWVDGRSPSSAHTALRRHDPELADAVEALAPMLLGRAQAREEGSAAARAIEQWLR